MLAFRWDRFVVALLGAGFLFAWPGLARPL
jgi:hypothetical protein